MAHRKSHGGGHVLIALLLVPVLLVLLVGRMLSGLAHEAVGAARGLAPRPAVVRVAPPPELTIRRGADAREI